MRTRFALAAVLLPFLALGCTSMVFGGGELAKAGYEADVIVDYRAEGTVPANVTYHLVRTPKGEAFFERSPDGSGTLFTTKRTTEDGDRFASWFKYQQHYAIVFFVPKDRSRPAKKYIYPAGTYEKIDVPGTGTWPEPIAVPDPVATLYPK